ncbi:glycosyltransferase family 2 protein [Maribacter litoralis]|uniref:glycosyltransferase family 2 protein n=1 Tax=Maribacter litoralis TaxID=2059726 RepID=UPI003F5CC9C8
MLLSIIVPVYNIERYIATCIKSILDQDLDKNVYEILVIDDGSTDKSSDIVNSFEKKHSNLTVYKQNNLGLGGARKTGIRNAKGKYLYFLDGDDYIARNTLKILIYTIEKHNLDILGFKTRVTERLDLKNSTADEEKISISKIQNGVEFLGSSTNFRIEVWWYLINKSFFENTGLTFEDKRFVNDSYFTPSLFKEASKVAFLPLDVYRYVQRPNSITSKKDLRHYEKHIKDLEYAIFQMNDLMESIPKNSKDAIKTIKIKQESYVFFTIVRYMKSDLTFSFLKKLLNKYRNVKAYPMQNLGEGKLYQSLTFKLMIFIFNQPFLLYPTVITTKLFFQIKRIKL